jgi:hypothetical protein
MDQQKKLGIAGMSREEQERRLTELNRQLRSAISRGAFMEGVAAAGSHADLEEFEYLIEELGLSD